MKIPTTLAEVEHMSHEDLCRLWRFATPGTFWKPGDPISEAAEARLMALGGFTPEISKRLGW